MHVTRPSAFALAALSMVAVAHAGNEAPESPQKSGAATEASAPPQGKPVETTDKPTGEGQDLVAAKPMPAVRREPTLIAKVDLTTQRMTIVVDGKSTHAWPISSGREGYATPVGSFTPGWKAKMWYSKQYDDAPMPHSVFFKNGAAIHATQAVGMLGRPASHGCVRLSPANAAIFYGLVGKHGLSQTRVVVFGTPKFAPAIAQRPPPVVQRVGQPRVIYANVQPRYVPAAVPVQIAGGFNNGGSWFGNGGYAYAQPQPVRYMQAGGYHGQGVRYLPRGYRPY